jgi:hypothetical protein
MELNKKLKEKIVNELFDLLYDQTPKELKNTSNHVLFQWLEESDSINDRQILVYRMHRMLDFLEKLEEIMIGGK